MIDISIIAYNCYYHYCYELLLLLYDCMKLYSYVSYILQMVAVHIWGHPTLPPFLGPTSVLLVINTHSLLLPGP